MTEHGKGTIDNWILEILLLILRTELQKINEKMV